MLDFLHNTGRHSLFSSDLRSLHALVIDGLLYALRGGSTWLKISFLSYIFVT